VKLKELKDPAVIATLAIGKAQASAALANARYDGYWKNSNNEEHYEHDEPMKFFEDNFDYTHAELAKLRSLKVGEKWTDVPNRDYKEHWVQRVR
jgi:hypothetical protein